MHAEAHINALSEKHSNLDNLINLERLRPNPNTTTLHELKKEKLKLKDEMSRFSQMI